MLSGGKKDVEFEEPGMDALGENMYSHISIFFSSKVLACWNSIKETLIIKSLVFPLVALTKWNKAENREEGAINMSVSCGKRFKEAS